MASCDRTAQLAFRKHFVPFAETLGYALSLISNRFHVELALNIAWLTVALLLLFLCGARALSFTERRRRITALIALTCLIWLLFPVISITDDLNAGTSVYDATAAKKGRLGELNTALAPATVLIMAPLQVAWREVNLHADLSTIQKEFICFDLFRRPPPERR
jgi:hypothetical protein